jgi:GNAT superfamily N-acetyltransferase
LLAGVYGWLWGECLEVDYLWVAERVRGQGIGRELMHKLEEAAKTRGGERNRIEYL